ncbi:MAG: aldehyde dehydrogenase family protein, partial [Bacillota bacterium]|nr:aldehyde dehydrogenase family protein [Bacillota bacterium]
CISVQRIFVHDSIYDSFVDAFVQETNKLKIGNPLDEDTDISSMITANDTKRTSNWVQDAIENGAKLAHGGSAEAGIFQPTVLLQVPLSEKVSCEEVFAPVVHINRFQSFNDAIDMVNESKYGLQAGIFTNDVHKAIKAAKKLEVGGVMINEIPTFRVDQMPYGGVKMSGMGREGIKYAIEEMTELKLISFKTE